MFGRLYPAQIYLGIRIESNQSMSSWLEGLLHLAHPIPKAPKSACLEILLASLVFFSNLGSQSDVLWKFILLLRTNTHELLYWKVTGNENVRKLKTRFWYFPFLSSHFPSHHALVMRGQADIVTAKVEAAWWWQAACISILPTGFAQLQLCKENTCKD